MRLKNGTGHDLRVKEIRNRVNLVIPNIVVPVDHRVRTKAGWFALVAAQTAEIHGLRKVKESSMRQCVRKMQCGEGAVGWMLDIIDVTLKRFESGEFPLNSMNGVVDDVVKIKSIVNTPIPDKLIEDVKRPMKVGEATDLILDILREFPKTVAGNIVRFVDNVIEDA